VNQRRSGLGRGLGALIPAEVLGEAGAALQEIPTASIVPNRYQPREHFDEETLTSLTASVRELGVLQPILVRRADGGTYELIAGERRWRAAKRAGLPMIPALVRDVGDVHALEQALVENLHRQDLNALEEAAAYQQLIEDFRLTQEEVAQRVGKSRSAVANALRLFQLPPSVQRMLADSRLSAGHARALLTTPDRARQEQLAEQIVREGLSVREVEQLVRAADPDPEPVITDEVAVAEPSDDGEPAGQVRAPAVLELEELLSARLHTRVKVSLGSNRGRVVVEFADLDDLERIYRIITPPGTEVDGES
jgi:ParB family transcriptional regulator, chromosome partitioning protein